MKRIARWKSALAVLFLAACGSTDEAPPPSYPHKSFWTVHDFSPEKYDQKDVNALIYGQPEEDKPIILTLIRQLIDESLTGVEQADDLTKILHMAWYIHTHFASEAIEPFSLRSALEHRKAQCAASSTIFQMMVRSLGFKTRSTGFFGVPIQASHTTSEVFIDDDWRYIDPSFGVFFTADGLLSRSLLSMDTILTYRYAVAANTLYPISEGRLGWQERDPTPTGLEQLFSKAQTDLLSSGNYRLFLNETRNAIPYDVGYEMASEFTVDLASRSEFDIGTADHSIADIQLHSSEDNGIDFDAAQLSFVGDNTGTYGPLVNSHTYYLTGLRPGQKVHFRAGLVYGDVNQVNISVRKGTLDTLIRENELIGADITVLRRDIEIRVTANAEQRILFDYLHFQR